MTAQFNHLTPYEKRVEYHPTPEVTAVECALLADMSDELMEVPSSIGVELPCDVHIDKTHTSIYRAFRYLDSDSYGYLWPLVEKELIVSYERRAGERPTERYHIETNSYIHQADIETRTISTTYNIVYLNLARTAVAATIRSINLTESNPEEYTTRALTPYDAMKLGDEFTALNHALRSGRQEDFRAAQQGGF